MDIVGNLDQDRNSVFGGRGFNNIVRRAGNAQGRQAPRQHNANRRDYIENRQMR